MTPLPGPEALGPATAPRPDIATPAAPVAPAAAEAPAGEGVREAAEAMEGVFLSMLVEEMFKDTESFGSNPMYGGLATEKLGEELARSGGLGLTDLLTRQLGGETWA